jgi:hypothetical protein
VTEVRWTETAAGDLESIRDYIRHDSPVVAQLVIVLTIFHAARMFPADIAPAAR